MSFSTVHVSLVLLSICKINHTKEISEVLQNKFYLAFHETYPLQVDA